jgi:hypothetical protein
MSHRIFVEYISSESGAIRFGRDLDEHSMQALANCGLRERFPVEYKTWMERKSQARKNSVTEVKRKEAAVKEKLNNESEQLKNILREAIVDALVTKFPYVAFISPTVADTHDFLRTLSRQCLGRPLPTDEGDEHNVTNPAGAANFVFSVIIESYISVSEPFLNLIALYPKIGDLFQKTTRNATLDSITSRDFKSNKERLIMIYVLLDQRQDLDPHQRTELIQFVLKEDWQGLRDVLGDPSNENSKQVKSRTNWWPGPIIWNIFPDDSLSQAQRLIQEARSVATHTSDPDFLLRLKDISVDNDTLKAAIANTEHIAQQHFDNTISRLLKKLVHGAVHIQEEDCTKQIQREAYSQVEADADCFRTQFIREIEEQSYSDSISSVVLICACVFSSNTRF